MTDQKYHDRLTDLADEIGELEDELRNKPDLDSADREQLQALEASKRDLKRAGAHMGRSGATKHMDRAEDRLRGIKATQDL